MKTYRIKFNFTQMKRNGHIKEMRGYVDYETFATPIQMYHDPELKESLIQHAESSTDCKVLNMIIASIVEIK